MKKVFLFLFLVLSALTIWCELPSELKSALDTANLVIANSSNFDQKFYPGFKVKDNPVIIYETAKRYALALNFNPPPKGFQQIEGTSFSYGKIEEGEPLSSGLKPFSNRLVSFLSVSELNPYPSAKIVESAFKVFEAYRGFNDKGIFLSYAYPNLDAENNVLSRCENECLIKALTSSDNEILPLLSAFYSFRTKRQATLSKEVVEVENSREIIDGLASYAGYYSLTLEEKKSYLKDVIGRLSNYNKGGFLASERFKDSGFAIFYLLDKLKFDFIVSVEKSPKDSILPILQAFIEGIKPKEASFINIDAIRAEETQKVKEIEEANKKLISSITSAEGVVIYVKIGDMLEKTQDKITWSNWYEKEGMNALSKEKFIFSKYFKLSGNTFFNFASSRPILVEIKKSITVGFGKEEVPVILLDGKGIELGKDSPPITGKVEAKGVKWEMAIEKAKLTWDFTKRTLTVEPLYGVN